jgi:hypothetical protein
MVDMGAPEEEIDQYISLEGTTVEDVRKFQIRKPFISTAQKQAERAGELIAGGHPVLGGLKTAQAGITGTLEDLIHYPSMAFLNQLMLNAPRSIMQTTGREYPTQATSPAGQGLANLAGIAGGLMSPIGQIGAGAAKAPMTLMNLAKLAGAGALAGGAYSPSDNFGDMGQRAGQAGVSAVIPGAGKMVSTLASKIPNKSALAGRIVNSLIKPLKKDFAYGKNPGLAVAQEGIIANNFDELAEKIGQRRQEVGKQIGGVIKNTKEMIDVRGILRPIDVALAKARQASNTNASLITRLEGLREDLRSIVGGKDLQLATPQLAFKMKQKVGDLTKWTGNVSDDQSVNKSLKMVYGRLKQRIENVIPTIKSLNDRYADLTSAEVATKYRDVILQRQNMISLGATQAGLGSALITAIATGGQTVPSILIGIGAGGLAQATKSPAVKTRIAAMLAKTSPEKMKVIFSKLPQLKELIIRGEIALPSRIIDKLRSE